MDGWWMDVGWMDGCWTSKSADGGSVLFLYPLLWTLALQETQFGRGELEAPAVAGFALSEGGQCRSSGSEE